MVSEEQAEIGQVSTASDHCEDIGLGIDTQKARAAHEAIKKVACPLLNVQWRGERI